MKHFESFESNRWIWRVNLALQVALVIALLAVVNVIATSVWTRVDLTRHRVASLSAEARNYVRELDRRTGDQDDREPVKIVVTLNADSDDPELNQVYRDVRALLREFEYAARDNQRTRIQVEYLNVFQDRTRAQALNLADLPNVVVFQYRGAPPRIVQINELYVVQQQERHQFVGEKAFVSALLDVTSAQRPVLYFLTGHGEMRSGDIDPGRGASQLDTQLRTRAYDTQVLDLAETRRIPDDAGLVLVLAPQTPLLRAEQEIFREYLTRRAGKVIIALSPGRNHGLDDLFFEWGILADDVLAIETSPAHRTESGDLHVRGLSTDHPITRNLVDNNIAVLMGAARSVRPDPGRAIDESLIVTPLLRTSDGVVRNQPTSWGEADYRKPGPTAYDRDRDLAGPIFLGTVAERRVQKDLGVNVQGGRLVVFGSGDFLANHRLGALGNLTMMLNAVSWALNPEQRVDIPARPIERLKLNLSQQQLQLSGFAIVLGPALAVTLFGLAVYFSRRR